MIAWKNESDEQQLSVAKNRKEKKKWNKQKTKQESDQAIWYTRTQTDSLKAFKLFS